MGLLDVFKTKKAQKNDSANTSSYIAGLKHIEGLWHQYDFLLATGVYGWEYMVDSADYVIKAELEHIGTVSISRTLQSGEEELIGEFTATGCSVKEMKSLADEASVLGVGGMSKIIGGPMKIVWINQTRTKIDKLI